MDNYEKKYNEALAWMRELYPGLHGATKEDAEHYFPELRESEDERIRKELIEFIKSLLCNDAFDRYKLGSWIAWLESLRPQPHWKPSEEQMNALVSARFLYRDGLENSETASALESLCVDLNKLRYGSTK